MLALFKKNSFFNSMMLLGYAAVLQLIPAVSQFKSSDIAVVKGIITPFVHVILLFIQAVFINRMIIENRLHRDIMLFPGVFYILFASIISPFWNLSHILIPNFFIIWALFELFQVYKVSNPAVHIFNASFLVGVASIFCAPTIFYLLLIFVGISNLKKMELVHPLQILVGGFVPWFLWVTYHIWNGTEKMLLEDLHFGFTLNRFQGGILSTSIWVVLGLLLLFLFISYNEVRKKKHIQAQKKVDILYFSMFTAILVLLFHVPLDQAEILFVVPFIGVFVGLLVSHIKNSTVFEFIHLLIWVGVILLQIVTLFM